MFCLIRRQQCEHTIVEIMVMQSVRTMWKCWPGRKAGKVCVVTVIVGLVDSQTICRDFKTVLRVFL